MELDLLIRGTARLLELAGVSVIALGSAFALVAFLVRLTRPHDFSDLYRRLRCELGRAILLGLELLVGADIIATVTTRPNLDDVLALGVIVIVRTFLSFSLETEIEGHWPWQRNRQEHAQTP